MTMDIEAELQALMRRRARAQALGLTLAHDLAPKIADRVLSSLERSGAVADPERLRPSLERQLRERLSGPLADEVHHALDGLDQTVRRMNPAAGPAGRRPRSRLAAGRPPRMLN